MRYTVEQVELFNRMFSITREYDSYYAVNMNAEGEIIEEDEEKDRNYNADSVEVTVKDKVFVIPYGKSNAEEAALIAFNKFIELEYNEDAFIEWLKNNSDFE